MDAITASRTQLSNYRKFRDQLLNHHAIIGALASGCPRMNPQIMQVLRNRVARLNLMRTAAEIDQKIQEFAAQFCQVTTE